MQLASACDKLGELRFPLLRHLLGELERRRRLRVDDLHGRVLAVVDEQVQRPRVSVGRDDEATTGVPDRFIEQTGRGLAPFQLSADEPRILVTGCALQSGRGWRTT